MVRAFLVACALGLFGCPEHHTVVPRDAATPDAPAELALCRTASGRCMLPESSARCPERIPTAGTACARDGVACAYCPDGVLDSELIGVQARGCLERRWISTRVICITDGP
jgi:hypothetical protein